MMTQNCFVFLNRLSRAALLHSAGKTDGVNLKKPVNSTIIVKNEERKKKEEWKSKDY